MICEMSKNKIFEHGKKVSQMDYSDAENNAK
jgi:hypothetical protein